MGVGGFLKTVGKVAYPFLSTAASAGGPLGTMAAAAVGKALGIDKQDATPEGLANAMASATMDAEQRVKLIQAENDFKLQMAALGFKSEADIETIGEQDRDSARKREEVVKDKTPAVLACLAVIGLVFAISLLAFHVLPPGSESGLLVLIGGLAASYKDVYGYYFGSSAGSQGKDATIQKLASS